MLDGLTATQRARHDEAMHYVTGFLLADKQVRLDPAREWICMRYRLFHARLGSISYKPLGGEIR